MQVTKSNIISYYEIDKYENKTTGTIPFSSLVLNDLIKDFYNNNSFHEEKILLSNTDRELVMASLENPPEPNEALKELFINN